MSQREIGVRMLRADLAGHVQRAGRGDGIVVTVNGRPTARLGPLTTGAKGRGADAGTDDLGALDVLDALAEVGLMRRPIDTSRRLVRPDPVVGRYPADVDPARAVTEALGR
jgi:prevent-host-death family protein